MNPRRIQEFDAIVRAHQGVVRTFLRRLTRNSALADELAQETFLAAFRKIESLESVRDIRAWLLRLAYRRFLDDHRRTSRRRALSEDQPVSGDTPQAPEGLKLDIAQAMNRLPPERHAVAMLCLAYGHSHSEAADITGLPLGTVKSHVNRAKTALQTSLQAYQGASHE